MVSSSAASSIHISGGTLQSDTSEGEGQIRQKLSRQYSPKLQTEDVQMGQHLPSHTQNPQSSYRPDVQDSNSRNSFRPYRPFRDLQQRRLIDSKSSSSNSDFNHSSVSNTRRYSRTRKIHTKSRQGCFTCKRRKIKCPENLPACDKCVDKGFQCRYPIAKPTAAAQAKLDAERQAPSIPVTVSLQSTGSMFSLEDMRLFHHFILEAYPHLPAGNEKVWVRDVPAFAHQYPYLMHALLGLGASHLTAISNGDYRAAAIKHRCLAIKGFNEALSIISTNDLDDDALLAACYALSFQSTYLRDRNMPAEYVTMLRGCGLVTSRVKDRKSKTYFALTAEDHYRFMMPRLKNLPTIEADLYEGAGASLELLESKVDAGINRSFYQSLLEIVAGFRISSLQGYLKYVSLFQAIANLPHEPFNEFVSPNNVVAPFLLAHLFGLQVILSPVLRRTWEDRQMVQPVGHRLDWIRDLYDGLGFDERPFLEWPIEIARRARAEMDGKLSASSRSILGTNKVANES